jgi:hypothetical protein
MSDPNLQSPFVVTELRPVNKDGQEQATYQLSKASVSPQVQVGRDARGFPQLETVPTVPWKPFLMPDGCINKVPIRTGSVPSMHADAIAYENETVTDLILAGAIPAWLCPYSTKYSHLTDGPFAQLPTDEHGHPIASDCGGSHQPAGCLHLQAIAKVRRDEVFRKHQAEMETFSKQRDVEYERMRGELVKGIGEAVGESMAKHMAANLTPQQRAEAAKQRLKDNKSDPGKVVEE